MKTYRFVTTNGVRHDLLKNSASDAIQEALERSPGYMGESCETGGIRFDIPNHDALPKDWVKPKRIRKQDATTPMFDDDAIRAE